MLKIPMVRQKNWGPLGSSHYVKEQADGQEARATAVPAVGRQISDHIGGSKHWCHYSPARLPSGGEGGLAKAKDFSFDKRQYRKQR